MTPKHGTQVFVPGMLIWTIVVHAIAFYTLIFAFDLKLFLIAFIMAMFTAYPMGIFHHMQLTHESFECKPWVTRVGALLGTLSWRGSFAPPLKYVAVHSVHHKFSDTEHDPHSPVNGLLHSFMGWFWQQFSGLYKFEEYQQYVADRWKNDAFLRFYDRYPNFLQFLLAALLLAIGGWKLVLYGIFVKTLIVLWAANTVDLINHTVGYRNYETKDHSTNSFFMAALHLGGAISWHNNHHAHPEYFSVRKKWWEFDAHYIFLRVLEKFGLVWNIRYLDQVK